MAGLFITFEGIEGCGKSTQLARAAAVLREEGADVTVSREPGGTPIGDAIRAILLNEQHHAMTATTELLLYAASRAQHVAEIIIPARQRGALVLVDRFTDSTTAYQGAARSIDRQVVDQLADIATTGVTPDVTILLDVPVEVGLARIGHRAADRLEQESVAFHEQVRQGYLELAKAEPERIHLIDGTREEETVHHDIMQVITQYVEQSPWT